MKKTSAKAFSLGEKYIFVVVVAFVCLFVCLFLIESTYAINGINKSVFFKILWENSHKLHFKIQMQKYPWKFVALN